MAAKPILRPNGLAITITSLTVNGEPKPYRQDEEGNVYLCEELPPAAQWEIEWME